MEPKIIKVLRIRKGEYLLELTERGVVTTFNRDAALDISGWSMGQLALIVKSLGKAGYKKVAVERIGESE